MAISLGKWARTGAAAGVFTLAYVSIAQPLPAALRPSAADAKPSASVKLAANTTTSTKSAAAGIVTMKLRSTGHSISIALPAASPEPTINDSARAAPGELTSALRAIWSSFPGKAGIAVMKSDGSWLVSYRGDEPMPQQSVSKLWVAIAVMDALHVHGIRLAIDDFGAGYSSLNYLNRFKASRLKIDQSFVRDITEDPEDRAIVSAIISIARSLGLKTIAEGVETEGQLAFLRESGCDEVQGYLFSRPLPAEDFVAWMQAASRSNP